MKRPDGGTAFPMQDPQAIHAYATAAIDGITDHDERDLMYTKARGEAIGGMSLRDYFAARAMPIAATFYDTSEEVCEEAAAWCYKMADAMLAAREDGK